MSRLFQKLESGQMALGVWLKSGPSWVATLARAGFDCMLENFSRSLLTDIRGAIS